MRVVPFAVAGLLLAGATPGADAPKEGAPQAPTFGTTVVVPGGLHGTVYFIPTNTSVLPDFERAGIERVGEIWTDTLNIPPRHWRAGFPGLTKRFEWFAIDYTGRFWIGRPERYTFALLSDDGARLYIDGTPVIDNDCEHPPDVRIAAVKLEGGVHAIRVSYFQGPRDCLSLVLAIAGPDHEWQVFNTMELKPPANPEDWHFPAQSSVAIVPVTPEEASLSVPALLKQLVRTDPHEKLLMDPKSGSGCSAAPVRFCGH